MRGYVLKRLAQAVGVLWAAFTVSFVILYYLPGDPVSAMAGAGADSAQIDPAQLAALRSEYGFDKPLLAQYADALGRAVRGDFGDAISTGRPVASTIADALPQTLQLTSLALLLAVVCGGGLAVLATYTRARWLRQTLLSLPPLGVSVPTFWVGLVLVELFSFRLRWFPAFGNDGLDGLILPAVTLAVPTGALVAQVLAKSLLTALDQAYVETARAKGAGRWRIHLRHALRNASLPALTVVGLLVGQLVAGSVVVETVFSRDGLGRVTAAAVTAQDIPLVQGVVVFGALVFVLANLLVDLVYPLLDPRIVVAPSRKAVAA
ncbi:ABC transporter permease [Streptomyces acidiscabies]|uniref:ABC transporter permease n=1 Tax=Streptomyces acidiscabies TaxID=42234 RepID=A0AAP6BB05_9ACTN|nr:ABC transporter permease [Streptomyces acidiscabies]MBP5935021.1 ABC transporter permease [Streptomyces sp. LBUM 1476]MBZ3917197.1 ABC transporter permease [Streptomyces acidiscabies]MDX2961437.1 ABC transporter permease [Streptomyces acidiscabies]MDX3023225.1 ABC transporter permease [Streptomyces acidiscabies]MDX3792159.1 ABC transporter permease [Streptomyces acidiscabies]